MERGRGRKRERERERRGNGGGGGDSRRRVFLFFYFLFYFFLAFFCCCVFFLFFSFWGFAFFAAFLKGREEEGEVLVGMDVCVCVCACLQCATAWDTHSLLHIVKGRHDGCGTGGRWKRVCERGRVCERDEVAVAQRPPMVKGEGKGRGGRGGGEGKGAKVRWWRAGEGWGFFFLFFSEGKGGCCFTIHSYFEGCVCVCLWVCLCVRCGSSLPPTGMREWERGGGRKLKGGRLLAWVWVCFVSGLCFFSIQVGFDETCQWG